MACSDTATILIEIPIDHIVAAILNGPVTAIHFENALWACLFWRATGYPQNDIIGDFSGTFVKGLSHDQEYLPNMWEIEVFIQLCSLGERIIAQDWFSWALFTLEALFCPDL